MKTVIIFLLLIFPGLCFSSVKGDINGDGEVDISDAVNVLQTVVGINAKIVNSEPVPISSYTGTYTFKNYSTTYIQIDSTPVSEGKLVITTDTWTEYIKTGKQLSTTQGKFRYFPAQNTTGGLVSINWGNPMVEISASSDGIMVTKPNSAGGIRWLKESEQSQPMVYPDVPPLINVNNIYPMSAASKIGGTAAVNINYNLTVQQDDKITFKASARDKDGVVLNSGTWQLTGLSAQGYSRPDISLNIPLDKPGTVTIELYTEDSRGLQSDIASRDFTITP